MATATMRMPTAKTKYERKSSKVIDNFQTGLESLKAWQTMPSKKLPHIKEYTDPLRKGGDPGLVTIGPGRIHDDR